MEERGDPRPSCFHPSVEGKYHSAAVFVMKRHQLVKCRFPFAAEFDLSRARHDRTNLYDRCGIYASKRRQLTAGWLSAPCLAMKKEAHRFHVAD
jgi:hypothetical protein